MKKLFYLLSFISLASIQSFAQDEDGRIPQRMAIYIENKLDLNKSEKEKFHPVFLEYHRELRKTTTDNRDDRLVLQQKIAELRLRYRDTFKSLIGEKKANDVFFHEREFMREALELRKERMERRGGQKRKNNEL